MNNEEEQERTSMKGKEIKETALKYIDALKAVTPNGLDVEALGVIVLGGCTTRRMSMEEFLEYAKKAYDAVFEYNGRRLQQ